MKKKFSFGKIDFYGKRKINEVVLTVEYDEYGRFSVCGDVWNSRHTDIVCGGQCLDTLLPYFIDNELFMTIYRLWKDYHFAFPHKDTITKEDMETINKLLA